MCENLKYWVKLYMARVIKGNLIVVAVGFLFFQCSDKTPAPETPAPANPASADSDGDGLIDIKDATMLNNMRYNLAGTSYKTSENDAGDADGCPTSGCNGYELMTNIDLAVINISQTKSWVPIGDNLTNDDKSRFTGIFEGNNNTIANLWVDIASSAGLFGVTGGTVTIRNVGVISGSIHSSAAASFSGGLVGGGVGDVTITNSYFSGGNISSSSSSDSYSGGLVGSGRTVSITNSY